MCAWSCNRSSTSSGATTAAMTALNAGMTAVIAVRAIMAEHQGELRQEDQRLLSALRIAERDKE